MMRMLLQAPHTCFVVFVNTVIIIIIITIMMIPIRRGIIIIMIDYDGDIGEDND